MNERLLKILLSFLFKLKLTLINNGSKGRCVETSSFVSSIEGSVSVFSIANIQFCT